MKVIRQIGSLAFVLGLFVVVFAGVPWHVVVADAPVSLGGFYLSKVNAIGNFLDSVSRGEAVTDPTAAPANLVGSNVHLLGFLVSRWLRPNQPRSLGVVCQRLPDEDIRPILIRALVAHVLIKRDGVPVREILTPSSHALRA